MSIKSFFTAFFDTLSDLQSRFQFKQELRSKLIADEVNNIFEGKKTYFGVVLQVDNGNPTNSTSNTALGSYTQIKVRINEIHDKTLPEPCLGNDVDRISEIVDMHPTAFSEHRFVTNTPAVGDTVECFYSVQGPQYEGVQRGLRFRDSTLTRLAGHHKFSCLDGYDRERSIDYFGAGGVSNFSSPRTATLIDNAGSISNGKIVPGRINATWEQYKEFGALGLLTELHNHIAAKESGGDYDNYNINAHPSYPSRRSSTRNYGKDPLVAAWGKKLTELTIHQVAEQVMREKKIPRYSGTAARGSITYHTLWASGKYQIIPRTLRSSIDRISGCNTNELYNKESQEAFGTYLLLGKKPDLGKYLFGDKKITTAKAQIAVAQEWAAMRIPENFNRPKMKRPNLPARLLLAGQGYYCGDPFHKSACKVNLASAQKTFRILQETRAKIDQSPEAQKLIKKILGK